MNNTIVDGKTGFFIKNIYVNRIGIMMYFGVKRNSYVGSIVNRIYDYYCMGSRSVYIEYVRYYRREFKSYSDFLQRKYNFFKNEISGKNKYLLYYKELSFTEDGGIVNLINDESFKSTIIRFLGGEIDEN